MAINDFVLLTSLSGLTILSLIFFKKIYRETFLNQQIQIIPIEIGRRFLQFDLDGYVQQFSSEDLVARKADTTQEYLKKSAADVLLITDTQKATLIRAVDAAGKYFETYRNYYIDPVPFQNLPWKFIMTAGYYENGLPHTRADYIFITPDVFRQSEDELVRLLIHEKVHIYQRTYKELVQEKLKARNYQVYRLRKGYPLIRANPDLDENIYLDPENNVMVQTYASMTPKNISDVKGSYMEHPYEEMAYAIANSYGAKWYKHNFFLFV